jgi:hypothetical protein
MDDASDEEREIMDSEIDEIEPAKTDAVDEVIKSGAAGIKSSDDVKGAVEE